MVRMIVLAAMLAIGCKQKPAEDTGATPGQSGAMATSGAMGSALGTTMMDAPPAAARDASAARSPEAIAQRYGECMGFRNASRWEEWRACYATGVVFEQPGLGPPRPLASEVEAVRAERAALPDLHAEPQVVMIGDNTVIAIVLVAGTNPQTKQPFGIYLGNVVASDPSGAFTRDLAFFDARTRAAQIAGKPGVRAIARPLPAHIAVISKDDAVERKNRDTFLKMMEASEKHDLVTYGSFVADSVVWSVQNQPKDLTKAEVLAAMQVRIEKTDLHYRLDHVWAAGDFLASLETVAGTAAADAPDKRIKRGDQIAKQVLTVHRFADGKLVQVWVFVQG